MRAAIKKTYDIPVKYTGIRRIRLFSNICGTARLSLDSDSMRHANGNNVQSDKAMHGRDSDHSGNKKCSGVDVGLLGQMGGLLVHTCNFNHPFIHFA